MNVLSPHTHDTVSRLIELLRRTPTDTPRRERGALVQAARPARTFIPRHASLASDRTEVCLCMGYTHSTEVRGEVKTVRPCGVCGGVGRLFPS